MCPLEKRIPLANFQSSSASLVHLIWVWAGFLRVRPRCGWRQDFQRELSLTRVRQEAHQDWGLSPLWTLGGAQASPARPRIGEFLASRQGNSPSHVPCQAGNGAGSKPGDILDVLTQYRGLSWR